MTSKLTRERLQEIAEDGFLKHGESKELARMALAAMESEPVAENIRIADALEGLLWPNMAIGNKAVIQAAIEALRAYHAQPAPVVQCPFPCGWGNLNKLSIQDAALVARGLVEGEPTTEAERQAAISNNDRLLKVISACRASMLHAGNSPAQSDCCPAQNVVAPAQSPIDHGYLPECECAGCKATARICAELSVNSPANPGCWCRTCRPVDLNDMRFVVCPDCGSKRCPRANDHRNACTGSNEPGQEGSAHPDTPQSPGSEPATVPGKWIPVSERMPEVGDIVLTAMGGSVNIGEMECSAANCRFFTSVISGRELPATHWMPLPASPQEVK